ncbi:MAG: MBL fold metallo-hydrolase, partial [Desulfobacterales bacterium]
MKTVITILADNCVSRAGLIGEHGFSALIEKGDEKFLFDTGPGMSLPHNTKKLEKDLRHLDKIIISHGHYDHTGGLKWAIQRSGEKTEVVAHPKIFAKHMVRNPGEAPKYWGCPFTREELEESGAQFHMIDRTSEISPGMWFITGIDLMPEQVPVDARLVIPQEARYVLDPIEDDASLLIDCEGSAVLVLGCAHSGILNILDHVENKLGIKKLQAVVGGTHLKYFDAIDLPRV